MGNYMTNKLQSKRIAVLIAKPITLRENSFLATYQRESFYKL